MTLCDIHAKVFLLLGMTSMSPVAAFAQAFLPFYIANVKAEGEFKAMHSIRGSCAKDSHTAVGPIGADLTQNHTPFVCDAAILTVFDEQNIHSMITFAEKATTKGVISLAGNMDAKENILEVRKVYLEPGKPTYFEDAACKFFFSGRHMSGIACIGKYDADGQRTVLSIDYQVDFGQ